ncbi:Glu/Leu/Phe/Val dehydrogenase dimerization domain-containing protein [Amycolatopsis rhabdoformis]|uniref:Glutamate dehydrogenase n=1 Tax=Amycolatopsis rhabdoformis TaxID=1448059 RepID=A0ABZ1IK71_9PSEU|nr:Glu/Leu/Phe/Val dehydrogenase dimerization domain-containing protein [Amycolatopsis rhabdoformis]WSE34648.1 Glu/Leu/Phe/Val dehydrogenase dimerization domain-containing protein [Amycolatopsis rhabdoformis]
MTVPAFEAPMTPAGPPASAASREPHLQITWTDAVTGRAGFVVIDRLVRGVCSGGLRMREGCTLDEVRGLAEGMTRKEALHFEPGARYVPLGGAKGGLDCSPHDPAARGVLTRFLAAVRAIVEQHWTTGEDLGVRQDTLDEIVAGLGLTSSVQAVYPLLDNADESRARLAKAFAIDVDGVALPELVGGLGVAQAALTAAAHLGIPATPLRAFVQGFGSMGGATARYLARAGVLVVGLADANGVLANPAGLDVEELLRTRDPLGGLDRTRLRPADRELPPDAWLDVECDVLVPAAVSYCLDEANQHRVTARLVVEAANLPTSPAAEAALAARGVTVVPDFVANSATNAWWWWTLFGDLEADAEQAEAKVRTAMQRIVGELLITADADGGTPRTAAQRVVDRKLAEIERRYPA